MLLNLGARERTAAEYRDLLSQAGFQVTRWCELLHPLAWSRPGGVTATHREAGQSGWSLPVCGPARVFLLVRDHQPVALDYGVSFERLHQLAATKGRYECATTGGSQREQLLPTRATLERWPAPIATSMWRVRVVDATCMCDPS